MSRNFVWHGTQVFLRNTVVPSNWSAGYSHRESLLGTEIFGFITEVMILWIWEKVLELLLPQMSHVTVKQPSGRWGREPPVESSKCACVCGQACLAVWVHMCHVVCESVSEQYWMWSLPSILFAMGSPLLFSAVEAGLAGAGASGPSSSASDLDVGALGFQTWLSVLSCFYIFFFEFELMSECFQDNCFMHWAISSAWGCFLDSKNTVGTFVYPGGKTKVLYEFSILDICRKQLRNSGEAFAWICWNFPLVEGFISIGVEWCIFYLS